MKKRISVSLNVFLVFLAVMPAFLYFGCGSDLEIISEYIKSPPLIDGSSKDWNRSSFLTVNDVSISVKHDDAFMYVCLKTAKKELMNKMLMRGFITWFPTKSDKRKIGIKYPISMMELRREGMMQQREEIPNGEGIQPGQGQRTSMDEIIKNLDNINSEIEIIGPMENEKDRIPKMSAETTHKLSIALGDSLDIFVYEMKIPFESDMLGYRIDRKSVKELKFTFESPKPDMQAMGNHQRPEGGAGVPGIGGPGMGGGQGRSGGMRGGSRPEGGQRPEMDGMRSAMTESLEFSVLVKFEN